MNSITVVGRLTKDVEPRVTKTGKTVAEFSLACKRKYQNETDFFDIIAWGAKAELCANYLSKGSQVAITGEQQTRSYENKDGRKVKVYEIMLESVEFLSPKKESKVDNDVCEQDIADDDLPF